MEDIGDHDSIVRSEEALLGAVFCNETLKGAEHVKANDFKVHRHRWLWEAIQEVSEQGPIDLVSTESALAKRGKLDEVGGFTVFADLISRCPNSVNVGNYADSVVAHAERRKLQGVAQDIVKLSYENEREGEAMWAEAYEILTDAQIGVLRKDSLFLPASEYRLENLKPELWLVEDLLIEGGVNLLAGESAAGKTFLALDLALAYCEGGNAWARSVSGPKAVLYYGADMDGELIQRRVIELCSGREIEQPAHFYLNDDELPVDISSAGGLARVKHDVARYGAGLVIFDTFAAYFPDADLNAAGDMSKAMSRLRAITKTGATVLAIHHLNKGNDKTLGSLLKRILGSVHIIGGTDCAVVATRTGEGPTAVRTLASVKNRGYIEPAANTFEIESWERGGLVVTFSETSTVKVDTTFVELCAGFIFQAITENKQRVLKRKEVEALMDEKGHGYSPRTLSRAWQLVHTMPGVKIAKEGRAYTYQAMLPDAEIDERFHE